MRGWVVALLILHAALPVPADPSPVRLPFLAHVAPAPELVSESDLLWSASDSAILNGTLATSPTRLALGERVEIWHHERRWSSLRSEVVGLLADSEKVTLLDMRWPWQRPTEHRSSHVLERVELHLDRARTENPSWAVDLRASAVASGTAGAPCRLRATDPVDVPFEHRRLTPAWSPEWVAGWVEATCPLASVEAEGPLELWLYEVEGHLLHGNERHRHDFATGHFVKRNASNPLLDDHVDRVAQLIFPGADTMLGLRSEGNTTLRSAAFSVAGRLSIPPAPGRAEWGDWIQEPIAQTLAPEGLLLVRGAPHLGLRIGGATFNGPAPAASPEPAPKAVASGIFLVLAAAVTAWSVRRGLGAAAAALFSRVTRNRALEHPRRALIYDYVAQHPGATTRDLVQALQADWKSTAEHARILVRAGLLTTRRFGRSTAFYVPGRIPFPDQAALWRLRNTSHQQLLELLRTDPERTQHELARELDVRQSYVSTMLKDLAGLGLLEIQRHGRRRRYVPTTHRLENLLAPTAS